MPEPHEQQQHLQQATGVPFGTSLGTPVGASDEADEPLVGSEVTLTPADPPHVSTLATLEGWMSSSTGLAVSAIVRLESGAAEQLTDRPLWCSFRSGRGTLLLVSALARMVHGRPDVVDLTGVTMLAREPRRDAVRAPLHHPARLISQAGTYRATTIDLSSGGCRLRLQETVTGGGGNPTGEQFAEGETVDVELDLGGGQPLNAQGRVLRMDGRDVAIRFADLSEHEAGLLDATVLRSLSS